MTAPLQITRPSPAIVPAGPLPPSGDAGRVDVALQVPFAPLREGGAQRRPATSPAAARSQAFLQFGRLGTAAVAAAMVGASFFVSPPAEAQSRAPVQTESSLPRPESGEARQLRERVTRLLDQRFGGNIDRAFDHYAGADGSIDRGELLTMLRDAGIGNFITRGVWADEIIKRFDELPGARKNGRVDRHELQAALRGLNG